MIWAEMHRVHQEHILMEVEQIKAHRSKKEMQEMSIFESSSLKAMRKQMSWQKRER